MKLPSDTDLNVDSREFKPKNNAEEVGDCRVQDQVEEEEQEN